jgi:CO dehydrogenase/acetyl-CoA synthase epsilon subunit
MAVTTPKVIDKTIQDLLIFLGLKQAYCSRLKLSKVKKFKPEIGNCHINTLIQSQLEGGSVKYGWVIW